MKHPLKSDKPVAVIILNWNGEKLLQEFLPSVVRHTPDRLADVIVADNGSDDGSLKLLAEYFPMVEVIRFDCNHGFAEGYNRALKAVPHPYVVLLNSDVAAKDDWLTPLYNFMEEKPEVGAVQPKLLSYSEPGKFEYAGASGGFLDRNGYPYCRGRIFDTTEVDTGQYDESLPVFWATGAALMVRRELYNEVGGLDKDFFAHMEEIDLCWRIHLAGYEVWAVPAGRLYHLGGGSLPASDPRKTYLNFRNSLLMLHKNLPDVTRRGRLLRRRLLDTVAWCKFVATLDFRNASAIFRAHRDFSRMRRAYTQHPSTDLLATFPGADRNILTDYYLRGRKTFASQQ